MIDKINKYDLIITLGFYNPALLPKCDICFYPFLDCKTNFYIRYEVGTEEGVVALFLYEFAKNCTNPQLRDFINALDYGYLSAETNVSEEEFAELKNKVQTYKNPLLLVGSDISYHSQKNNILNMLSALRVYSNFEILCEEVLPKDFTLNPVANLPEHNGCVIFIADSSDSSKVSNSTPTLKISKEFARAWHLNDKQEIRFMLDSKEIHTICNLDENFGGIIGILHGAQDLNQSYPFKNIVINTAIKG